MADPLKLLFEIHADGRQSVAEFRSVSKEYKVEIEGIKKLFSQTVLKLPSVSVPTTAPTSAQKTAASTTVQIQKDVNAAAEAQVRSILLSARGAADANSIISKTFDALSNHLNVFVGQRIPLVGGAFVRITEHIKNLNTESQKSGGGIDSLGKSILNIATVSGKSGSEVATFLTKFVQIEGQAKRDAAAVEFFGATTAQKLTPELEAAGQQLSSLASESSAAGGALAGIAAPIAIALVAVAALTAGVVLAGKEIISFAKDSVEVDARLFDLSKQLGISTELTSTFRREAKLAGGDVDSIAQAVGIFQKHLEDSDDPGSKAADTFERLGVTATDTQGALEQTFTALAKLPEGYRQTATALELFGRSGKVVLGIIKQTNGDIPAAMQKARELGVLLGGPAAEGADNFSDSLDDLDLQLDSLKRNIERAFIPAAFRLVDGLSDFAKENQDVFASLGDTIREVSDLIGENLADGIRKLGRAWRDQQPIVGFLDKVEDKLKDIQEVIDAINEATDPDSILDRVLRGKRTEDEVDSNAIPAKKVQGPQPVPIPTITAKEQAAEAARLADAVVSESKRAAAANNQALEEMFAKGRINRRQQALETIADIKRVSDAEIARIDTAIDLKTLEIKALDEAQKKRGEIVSRDSDAYRAVNAAVAKLQQERLDKEADFMVQSKAIRARADKEEADQRRNQEKNNTDLLVREFDNQIKATQARIDRGAQVESQGLTIIEALEQAKVDARRAGLEKQKTIGFLTIQDQKDLNDQIQKLNQEADRLADEQSERRLARERATAVRMRDIKIGEIETTLELQRIAAERLIATQQAAADLHIKSEEDAARAILKIRLDLIDQETAAVNAKLAAAKSIVNVDDRARAEADLNNQLKVLGEQRKTIQADGNRDIDKGRQDDLNNARQYADALEAINDRIVNIQRSMQEEALRLMVLHSRPRAEIIAKQLELDIKEADRRHGLALRAIREDQTSNNARINFLKNFIDSLKAANKTTSDEYQKAVNDLADANEKKAALNAQEEEELKRSEKEKERIRTEAERKRAEISPLGQALESLRSGQLPELANGVQSFADVATVAFGTVTAAVNQLASGFGELLATWELTGSVGDHAFRRATAQILADISKQAAELAIMSLAYAALATTAVGAILLGGTPAQFLEAAALFGAVAIGAGLAAHATAGSLFKAHNASGDIATRGISGGQEPTPRNQTFNFGGQGPVETSLQAAREGSGGLLSRREANDRALVDALNNHTGATLQLNATISRLRTEPKGVVVADGLDQNPAAAGRAVLVHSNSDGDFNDGLASNLGLRR